MLSLSRTTDTVSNLCFQLFQKVESGKLKRTVEPISRGWGKGRVVWHIKRLDDSVEEDEQDEQDE